MNQVKFTFNPHMQLPVPRRLYSVFLEFNGRHFVVYLDESQLINCINSGIPVFDENGRSIRDLLEKTGKLQGRPAMISDIKNPHIS